MASTYTVIIRRDAENKQLVMEVLDNGGTPVASYGSIKLVLDENPGGSLSPNPGTTMGKELKIRETVGCDPITGDPRYCMMLRSEWYDDPLTNNPEV